MSERVVSGDVTCRTRRNAYLCNRLSHRVAGGPGAIRCGTGGCAGASGLRWEGAMITPIIHRVLTREDLARLVAEIGRVDQAGARAAEQAAQAGGGGAPPHPAAAGGGAGGRWAGCFPEWVRRRAAGRGMVRAYVTFAGQALALAARILAPRGPVASLCARAADEAEALHAALAEARRDYLGRDIHSAERRLERFLSRLGPGSATPPTLN